MTSSLARLCGPSTFAMFSYTSLSSCSVSCSSYFLSISNITLTIPSGYPQIDVNLGAASSPCYDSHRHPRQSHSEFEPYILQFPSSTSLYIRSWCMSLFSLLLRQISVTIYGLHDCTSALIANLDKSEHSSGKLVSSVSFSADGNIWPQRSRCPSVTTTSPRSALILPPRKPSFQPILMFVGLLYDAALFATQPAQSISPIFAETK